MTFIKELKLITSSCVVLLVVSFCHEDNMSENNKKLVEDSKLRDTVTVHQRDIEDEVDTLINSISFQNFWLGFRKIVLSKKYEEIKKVITVPFEVRGYLDNDPRLKLSNTDSIIKIFIKFLQEENASYLDPAYLNTTNTIDELLKREEVITHFELIRRVEQLEYYLGYSASGYWRRVEDMEFSREGGRWKFSRIYMDTKELVPSRETPDGKEIDIDKSPYPDQPNVNSDQTPYIKSNKNTQKNNQSNSSQ